MLAGRLMAPLSDGELCIGAPAGMMKREDDVLLGNPGANQVFRDAQVGPVVLKPDLAVADVDVNEDIVHAPLVFPTDLPHLVVAQPLVADEFGDYVLFRGSHVRHLLQEALHNGSVLFVSIHSSILKKAFPLPGRYSPAVCQSRSGKGRG